uniref:Transmembrane protein n=1 Tax=Odontella aurita TaxID=265563 RepID=A0A7S4JHN9_9STRA
MEQVEDMVILTSSIIGNEKIVGEAPTIPSAEQPAQAEPENTSPNSSASGLGTSILGSVHSAKSNEACESQVVSDIKDEVSSGDYCKDRGTLTDDRSKDGSTIIASVQLSSSEGTADDGNPDSVSKLSFQGTFAGNSDVTLESVLDEFLGHTELAEDELLAQDDDPPKRCATAGISVTNNPSDGSKPSTAGAMTKGHTNTKQEDLIVESEACVPLPPKAVNDTAVNCDIENIAIQDGHDHADIKQGNQNNDHDDAPEDMSNITYSCGSEQMELCDLLGNTRESQGAGTDNVCKLKKAASAPCFLGPDWGARGITSLRQCAQSQTGSGVTIVSGGFAETESLPNMNLCSGSDAGLRNKIGPNMKFVPEQDTKTDVPERMARKEEVLPVGSRVDDIEEPLTDATATEPIKLFRSAEPGSRIEHPGSEIPTRPNVVAGNEAAAELPICDKPADGCRGISVSENGEHGTATFESVGNTLFLSSRHNQTLPQGDGHCMATWRRLMASTMKRRKFGVIIASALVFLVVAAFVARLLFPNWDESMGENHLLKMVTLPDKETRAEDGSDVLPHVSENEGTKGGSFVATPNLTLVLFGKIGDTKTDTVSFSQHLPRLDPITTTAGNFSRMVLPLRSHDGNAMAKSHLHWSLAGSGSIAPNLITPDKGDLYSLPASAHQWWVASPEDGAAAPFVLPLGPCSMRSVDDAKDGDAAVPSLDKSAPDATSMGRSSTEVYGAGAGVLSSSSLVEDEDLEDSFLRDTTLARVPHTSLIGSDEPDLGSYTLATFAFLGVAVGLFAISGAAVTMGKSQTRRASRGENSATRSKCQGMNPRTPPSNKRGVKRDDDNNQVCASSRGRSTPRPKTNIRRPNIYKQVDQFKIIESRGTVEGINRKGHVFSKRTSPRLLKKRMEEREKAERLMKEKLQFPLSGAQCY